MRLIGLAVVVTLSLMVSPFAAAAQRVGKVPLIGVLFPAEPASPTEPDTAAFRQGLRDLGYVEGQNITVEYRYAHGKAERYAELVSELVRLQVNVMVVGSAAATLAAKNATQTIPIVTVGGGDPVRSGVVASLARPGSNVTGLVFEAAPEIFGKYVELLAETVPRLSPRPTPTRSCRRRAGTRRGVRLHSRQPSPTMQCRRTWVVPCEDELWSTRGISTAVRSSTFWVR
jgi:ABC-type uncharacterized transport system substrate-binding protein